MKLCERSLCSGSNSAPGSLYSFIFVSQVIFGGVDVASIVISKINGELKMQHNSLNQYYYTSDSL